jgi:membrane associated rhomboid family serine protease
MLHKLGWQLYFGPFLTSMFLHGGWLHILGNMWMLYIFGAAVEDRLGHGRYLAFYLLCGLASAGTQLWASWGSRIPELGASGAIAGVMGAYLILNPSARVTALIPIFFFVRLIEVPASLYLVFWLWTQLYAGRLALRHAGASGGVAWWAHIGGFAAGVVLLGVFLPAKRRS